MWNGNVSYPNHIAGHYFGELPNLHLVNMACSGETTTSMMSGSMCAPGGSQYQNALAFLRAYRGSVALVTIDIGGNDVVGCINAANAATCFVNGLSTMQRNLATILAGLRGAVGPGVAIVGMNVYDPLLGDWLAPPGPSRSLAIAAIAGLGTLNTDMEQVYAAASVPVANVQDAFQGTDMTHLVASQWGEVPVAVDRACSLLDIVCHAGQSEGFGDDPNTAGAAVIATAFEKVIGPLHSPKAHP
jgi:lysophospholipase L1-like esterase